MKSFKEFLTEQKSDQMIAEAQMISYKDFKGGVTPFNIGDDLQSASGVLVTIRDVYFLGPSRSDNYFRATFNVRVHTPKGKKDFQWNDVDLINFLAR